jgi:hypothetical protein
MSAALSRLWIEPTARIPCRLAGLCSRCFVRPSAPGWYCALTGLCPDAELVIGAASVPQSPVDSPASASVIPKLHKIIRFLIHHCILTAMRSDYYLAEVRI